MKTWEMIKELRENPNKKFISQKGTEYEMLAQIKHGCLYIKDTLRRLTSISLDREWEEVKEPVDFMDALRSGKKVMIKHQDIDGGLNYMSETYNEIDDVMYNISNYFTAEGVREILLNGKWYIED